MAEKFIVYLRDPKLPANTVAIKITLSVLLEFTLPDSKALFKSCISKARDYVRR